MLGSDIILAIAGNKIDLEHERTVPVLEAERYVYDTHNLFDSPLQLVLMKY